MRIKIDEDLPKGVAEAVRGVVPDTLTVIEEGLSGILDPALWETVQREQRFLITGDKAFANIKQYPPGTHSGVLLLRPDEDGIPADFGSDPGCAEAWNTGKPWRMHCCSNTQTIEGEESVVISFDATRPEEGFPHGPPTVVHFSDLRTTWCEIPASCSALNFCRRGAPVEKILYLNSPKVCSAIHRVRLFRCPFHERGIPPNPGCLTLWGKIRCGFSGHLPAPAHRLIDAQERTEERRAMSNQGLRLHRLGDKCNIRAGQEEYGPFTAQGIGHSARPLQRSGGKMAILRSLHLGPGLKRAPLPK